MEEVMADLNRIEVDRIVNLVVGFGWEKIKEEITDTDILLVLKKKRVSFPGELGAGSGQ
jgi:hypothetical protein